MQMHCLQGQAGTHAAGRSRQGGCRGRPQRRRQRAGSHTWGEGGGGGLLRARSMSRRWRCLGMRVCVGGGWGKGGTGRRVWSAWAGTHVRACVSARVNAIMHSVRPPGVWHAGASQRLKQVSLRLHPHPFLHAHQGTCTLGKGLSFQAPSQPKKLVCTPVLGEPPLKLGCDCVRACVCASGLAAVLRREGSSNCHGEKRVGGPVSQRRWGEQIGQLLASSGAGEGGPTRPP